MICEKLLGKIQDSEFANKTIDYVDFQWDEAFKRLHRKTSRDGRDIGINLDDYILTRGLCQDDVLAVIDDVVVAVNILKCEAIQITVEEGNLFAIAKACYEVGNRHATLLKGENDRTFLTPYNGPMLTMLEKLPGVTASVVEVRFNFDDRISASINSHTH